MGSSSSLVLVGTSLGLFRSDAAVQNLKKQIENTGISISFLKKITEMQEFIERGVGSIFSDTYLGLDLAKRLKDSKNLNVGIVFLRNPKDDFFTADRLKEMGPNVIGTWDEMITQSELKEIVAAVSARFLEHGFSTQVELKK